MIVAHLADLHLGYRAYHRVIAGGINARERDVARAFRSALDRVIEVEADLVLLAGDIFHTVRPSNSAITDAFRQLLRLRQSLPATPVVIVAGNHDSPRAVETGSILRLLGEIPDVVVVDDEARAVYLEALSASVLCLPHNCLASGQRFAIEPDPRAAVNILMLHGTVTGALAEGKLRYASEFGGVQVESSELRPEEWDYIALGHYHIATELAPNMWYAGAIERTSTNIWEEADGPKGFLTYDTARRRSIFHEVQTRPVIDLPRFSARRPPGDGNGRGGGLAVLDASEIDARIRTLVENIPDGLEGKIVRLVITDVPRELFRELDHQQIRHYKSLALHFHLDPRRPEVHRRVGSGAPGRRRTLEEEVTDFLQREWSSSLGAGDATRLVTLARRYLAEVDRAEPSSELPPPS